MRLSIQALRQAYLANEKTPEQVIAECVAKIRANQSSNAWITVLDDEQINTYVSALSEKPKESSPLWGIPFAIKDNIDLVDCETTAGCPAYAYQPEETAYVVQQ
ncbi:MAG: allophanate hydrolase, partial [Pseudomonadales bacterium]|nr:allophanate hydrolase [Pseudomonadales bacterium]